MSLLVDFTLYLMMSFGAGWGIGFLLVQGCCSSAHWEMKRIVRTEGNEWVPVVRTPEERRERDERIRRMREETELGYKVIYSSGMTGTDGETVSDTVRELERTYGMP